METSRAHWNPAPDKKDKRNPEGPKKEPKLNSNQQIVLEWLKGQVSNGDNLQYVLWEFTDNAYEEPAMGIGLTAHTKAWLELKDDEQFQVLAAFAEWGKEEVAE